MLVVPEGSDQCYLAQRSEPRTLEDYRDSVLYDFEQMRPWLIEGDVLDIGCGLGAVSALIAKHCKGKLHLVDGTGWGDVRVSYHSRIDVYNDREQTERLLLENGVEDYQWWPVGSTVLPEVQNVVSLISWGWHYPVSTYLEAVENALPTGGRLILDLRPGKKGDRELSRSFEQIGSYQGYGKCNKTVWSRK